MYIKTRKLEYYTIIDIISDLTDESAEDVSKEIFKIIVRLICRIEKQRVNYDIYH